MIFWFPMHCLNQQLCWWKTTIGIMQRLMREVRLSKVGKDMSLSTLNDVFVSCLQCIFGNCYLLVTASGMKNYGEIYHEKTKPWWIGWDIFQENSSRSWKWLLLFQCSFCFLKYRSNICKLIRLKKLFYIFVKMSTQIIEHCSTSINCVKSCCSSRIKSFMGSIDSLSKVSLLATNNAYVWVILICIRWFVSFNAIFIIHWMQYAL